MQMQKGQSVVIVEGGLIYVIGGVDRNNAMALASMEIYDPATNSWSIGAPLPNATMGAAGTKGLDGTVYVISGAGPGQNSIQAYNPITNTWTLKTDIPRSVWAADAATGEDGNIYVIGGSGGSDLVQVYNPTSDAWGLGSSMPTPRVGLGVIKGEDGLIYAIGGYSLDKQIVLSTVEAYNPVTNTWTIKTALPLPLCQFGITLGPLGKIYVLGGSANYGNNTGPFYRTVYSFSTATNIWENEDPMLTRRGELGGATVGNMIFAVGGANGEYFYLDTNEVGIVPDGVDPSADAYFDEEVGQGELIYFNGSRSTDNIGIANYTWVFNDVTPQILTGVISPYIFETVGVYNIMLNVTDWRGNWDTDNVTIIVNDTELPVADAYCDGLRFSSNSQYVTYRVEPGTAITYDASGSSDNVDSIENLHFEWAFGDGTNSEDMRISYTHIPLQTTYIYRVTLKVEDSVGNIGEDVIEIHFLEKEESMISCSAIPTNIALGNSISVTGSLISVTESLPITTENVTIIYTTPQILGGEKLSRETRLNSDGFFNDTFKPFAVGSWSVKAYWEGNVTDKSSTSGEVTFTVSKTSSSISCFLSSFTINEDESITVFGSTTPNIPEAIISLIYIKPEGTKLNFSVLTDIDGIYSYKIDPEEKGVWKVIASWGGDETMEGAISNEVRFTVIGAFRFPLETFATSIVIVLFLIGLHFSKSISFYISKLKKKL